MAHPADTASKGPAAFAGARLSPDEAERLASMFRPSWELDDAPFTGPGTLTDADLRALQGGGTHADVRAVVHAPESATHASNGAHAPPAPTQAHEPENSVIIDRTITADARPPAVKPATTIIGMAAPPAPQPVVQQAPPPSLQRPPTPISQRPVAPSFTVGPPSSRPSRPAAAQQVAQQQVARQRVAAPVSAEEAYPKKKSNTALWVGLGVGGVVVMGLVAWLATSSGSGEKAATPPAATTAAATTDKLSSIPPPPPATTAAATATADPTPLVTTVAAAPPPTPAPTPTATSIPTTPVTALPQAAPTHMAAAAAPHTNYPSANPTPAPHPAGKGKATIVRDVPF
jgi:hypothetical protein